MFTSFHSTHSHTTCYRALVRNLLIGGLLFYPMGFIHANDLSYDDGKRRDPFIPLLGSTRVPQYSAASTELSVGGIIYDPSGGSIAVLNGESYQEGDQVGNLTLISILKDRIVLKQEDKEKTLWIREEVADDIDQPEGSE